ncbi:hypothetical protein ACOSQ4_023256 [Xanthoceras sorbifolium]
MGGDFNEILKDEEKLGGSCRNSGAMARFRRAVDDCNLMDMGFRGDRFTWNNRQFNGGLIQERLDPLIIDKIMKPSSGDGVGEKSGSRFHFEQAWAAEEECSKLVKEAWATGSGTSAISKFQSSVAAIASSLGEWNWKKRRDSLAEIKSLKKELRNLFRRASDGSCAQRIKSLENKLDGLLERQEIYWRQRSRALWLKEGDKNTSWALIGEWWRR